jgi:opacity protein-like surface antigen
MRKILTTATLFLLLAAPARAADSGNPLSSLTDWFNEAKSTVDSYIKDVGKQLSGFGKEFEGIADDVVGELGLPDPTQLRKELDKVVTDSPIFSKDGVANEADRQVARGSAAAILSSDGQAQQAQAYGQTQTQLETVGQQAQAAQGMDVTQNVMKQMALQQAQTTQVLGGVRSDLLKMNEQQATGNLLQTNISRTLDGQQQQRNAEQVGTGFSNLKTASQAALF